MKTKALNRWLIRAGVTLIFLFLLAPILITVVISFSADNILKFPPTGWSFKWYATLFANRDFKGAFQVSLMVAGGASLLAAAVSIPAAMAIARGKFRGKTAVESFFLAPLLVPAIVVGLGLLLVFSPLGLKGTYQGLILANAGLVIPYVIRTTLLSLTTMDARCEEAAQTLGAPPLTVFRTVTLPLIIPGVLSGVVLAFLLTFDEAVVSLFLVSSRVRTLPIAMFDYVQTRTDPQLAAVSTLLIVLSLVIVVVIERIIGLRRVLT
ncbi:ABC transporter permease [Arthrobacter sp. NPDC056691]|uniref:ABC transporter permease n=1 Tax=Arthrobacter sp. NPDC056691 TaxID=3345913 RepID=UPI00366CCF9E